MHARFHPVFYKIKMHNKMTIENFKEKIQAFVGKTKDIMEKGTKIVVFVDEFNATSIMGVIKEVFIDHSMDGKSLPDNLLWVGAMNRYKGPDKGEATNFTGVATRAPDYIVREHPPSMDSLILNFSSLSESQERNYLKVLLESNKDIKAQKLESVYQDVMIDWIFKAQEFVRKARMVRVSLSIRGTCNEIGFLFYFLP